MAAAEAAEEMLERRREVVAEMAAEARRESFPTAVSVRHDVIEVDQTAQALEARA